jgi:uncharacterized iron-regulated protein
MLCHACRLLRTFWPIFLVTLAGCSINHAIRIENGQRIGIEQMIAEVRDAPVVFVGERHDMASHHELQLEVIKGLHKKGKPLAIGVEMFEIDSQPALDDWIAGKTPEDKFVRIYQENWRNLNWGLYQDIFLFARDNGIPMVALNPPQQIVQKVAQQGFSALSAAELRALPADSTAPLSEESIQFMTTFYPAHGKNGAAFRHICEAQALRNRVMARGIQRYLAHHPGVAMVVLAGGAHAWGKGGIPGELGQVPYKVILPPFPGIDLDDPQLAGADYLLD